MKASGSTTFACLHLAELLKAHPAFSQGGEIDYGKRTSPLEAGAGGVEQPSKWHNYYLWYLRIVYCLAPRLAVLEYLQVK